jgi:hypothetical protein
MVLNTAQVDPEKPTRRQRGGGTTNHCSTVESMASLKKSSKEVIFKEDAGTIS